MLVFSVSVENVFSLVHPEVLRSAQKRETHTDTHTHTYIRVVVKERNVIRLLIRCSEMSYCAPTTDQKFYSRKGFQSSGLIERNLKE